MVVSFPKGGREIQRSTEKSSTMKWSPWLIVFAAALAGGYPSFPATSEKLLLVLVDGLRWDYFNNSSAYPGFKRIADNGVKAEYVTPVFPSNSYPNWYTIVTGLYPESHGIVQNYMYDEQKNDLFLMALHSNASHAHWWNDAEPIWVTAEKRDLKTAVYWWDGCQVVIKGKRPTKCEEYANYWVWGKVNKDTLATLVDTLEKFQNENYRLGMVYYEAVDANGHLRGPDAKEREQSLEDIDSILNTLQDHIAKKGMENQVNLVVVSDHGMTKVDPETIGVIDVESVIDMNDIKLMLDRGAVSMILPNKGKEDKVYEDLKKAQIKGLTVYKKSEIPEHYHIKKHKLVQPILLIADQGYIIKALSDPSKMKPFAERIFRGYHGYDPYKVKDMRTVFYARGPSFKKGYVSSPLDMVDHYDILCRAMGMEALPNNGSWARIKDMLTGAALLTENHVGRDKKSRIGFFNKNKNHIHRKVKNVFKGKRKNLPSKAPSVSDVHLLLTIVISMGITYLTKMTLPFVK